MNGLLIGYGSIGRRHLSNLHDLGVDDWAVVHTGKGTLPLETPCTVRIYSNLVEALRRERPGFAVVANPTNLHAPTARACIDAGWHVLLEKPVAHALDGLDDLAEARTKAEVEVLVGFQFRHHSALRRMAELLRTGELGAPLHARVVWGEHLPTWHPWEDWRHSYAARRDLGGGVHHTICHPLDYLLMLFGPPVGVIASLGHDGPLGLEVPESADIAIVFQEGARALVHLDYWSRPPTHRADISCTEGNIRWNYLTGDFAVWRSSGETWETEDHPGVADRNELFVAEAQHFLDVTTGQAAPLCTLEEGIEVVRLCAAIERSAANDGVSIATVTDGLPSGPSSI